MCCMRGGNVAANSKIQGPLMSLGLAEGKIAEKAAKARQNLLLSFTSDNSLLDISPLVSAAVCSLYVNHMSC